MTGTNRNIARRLSFVLLLGAMLVGGVVPAASFGAIKPAPVIKGATTSTLPEHVHGVSVAIGPDGTPWFGVSVQGGGLSLANSKAGKLTVEALRQEDGYATSTGLEFDSAGDLWFAASGEKVAAIMRRASDGTVTEFALPKGEPVSALTLGPEGDIWFVRGGYGEKDEAAVGRMTTSGSFTQFPLEAGARPTSIAVGPDGALWFTEEGAAKIGRITTVGEVSLFALPPETRPRQIVAGPDGALWFAENGQARLYGKVSDRIGRITTDGQLSELPVPFGKGTSRLAVDPARGVIWFATEAGEISSISPSGNVGARGCPRECGESIEGLTLAADGSLWFAAANKYCEMCGGGSDLIAAQFGTKVGHVPAGALAPADPNGPPAVDPFAVQTDDPPPPIVRTEKPRELESTYALLTGYINTRGFPTTWQFRWGKTKKYGHKSFFPEYPFGPEEGAARVSEELYGLCPATTYHYEVIAIGSGGRVSGGDKTFRTPPQKHISQHCRGH
jgi:virginiamycin B lyase